MGNVDREIFNSIKFINRLSKLSNRHILLNPEEYIAKLYLILATLPAQLATKSLGNVLESFGFNSSNKDKEDKVSKMLNKAITILTSKLENISDIENKIKNLATDRNELQTTKQSIQEKLQRIEVLKNLIEKLKKRNSKQFKRYPTPLNQNHTSIYTRSMGTF